MWSTGKSSFHAHLSHSHQRRLLYITGSKRHFNKPKAHDSLSHISQSTFGRISPGLPLLLLAGHNFKKFIDVCCPRDLDATVSNCGLGCFFLSFFYTTNETSTGSALFLEAIKEMFFFVYASNLGEGSRPEM